MILPQDILKIKLTPTEVAIAQMLSKQENDYAKGKGYKPLTPDEGEKWRTMGNCGERAVSLALNVPRTTKPGQLNLSDLGGWIEVRTRSKANHELGWRPAKDDPDKPYVLVRGHDHPIYEIVGWAYGREIADRGKFYDVGFTANNKVAFYFLPQKLLNPICELNDLVVKKGLNTGANPIRGKWKESYRKELEDGAAVI